MEQRPIEEVVTDWFTKFRAIPEDLHILCPRTSPADTDNYDPKAASGDGDSEKATRIREGKERIRTVFWSGLLLALPKEKTGVWAEEYKERLGQCFRRCDKCVLNWHMCRKAWFQEVATTYNEEAVRGVESLFHGLDFERLDRGLEWAQKSVEEAEAKTGVFKVSSLKLDQTAFLLVIFDALCCLPYISLPDKRRVFQFVFAKLNAKRPLRLGSGVLVPAMTTFLFDTEPVRLRFAKACWAAIDPGSLTAEQFEWAVSDHLAAAITTAAGCDVSSPESYPQIHQFWEGFGRILPTLSEDLIVHQLRAMEVRPTPYDLLFQHMQCRSEPVLVAVIEVFSSLLKKAPTAFWDTLNNPKPFMVAEALLNAPLFRHLLSKSMELGIEQGGSENPPLPTAWIDVWIKSVKRDEKADACHSILNGLFAKFVGDTSISVEGRAACARAAFDVLADLLQSFLTLANAQGNFPSTLCSAFVSPNNILHLNSALSTTSQFKDQIVEWAEKRQQPFRAQNAAIRVVKMALELDSRATAEECKAIHLSKPYQDVVVRDSASLWGGFLDLLYPGNLEQARGVLRAMFPLLTVEEFRPLRKSAVPMNDARIKFNRSFDKLAPVVGTVLQRLCQFDKRELKELWGDCMDVILSFTVHGTDTIRVSAIELLKTITGEGSQSDAIVKMVQERPTRTIGIFNSAIKQTVRRPVEVEGANSGTIPPFGPVLHVLSVAQDMLSALCDPATGLLRKKSLSSPELQAVFSWWSVQWNWIENVFKSTEAWSRYMELTVMTDLCREMIELTESLVKETALLASSFKEDALRNGPSSKDESELQSAMMRKVLDPCGRYLYGLIRMLRLRDEYLVTITTRIVCQLLERLREVDVEIGTDSRTYIYRTCKVTSSGKYEVATNLTRQQKAELLMALDGDDDEVEIVGERRVPDTMLPVHERKTIGITATPQLKKQSKIDAWSKSGIGQRTNRDDVLELSSNLENRKSTLALIGLRQEKTRSPAVKPTKPSRPQPAVLDAERIKALKDSRLQAQLDKKKRDAEAIAKARAIRSGGLGLDQPPQRSEIMVESSEDEDDESDGDEGLAEFVRNQRAETKAQDDLERRQAFSLLKTHQGPIKKRKQNLNEKDMRARIDPNMGPLHHAILEWDIFHDGSDPPNGIGATKVSNTYRDDSEYRSTFHPLLLHEAWRSFVTAKDECTSKPFGLKVATRMTFDGFIQVTSLMPAQENKERQERPVSEGDIVIVSKANDPLKQKDAPHCLARIHKVQFKKGALEVEYRVSPKSRTIVPELIPGNTLHFVKITNMTTIEREYATLQGLQHYDLLQEVLDAKPSPILRYGEEAVQKCMGNYSLNPGQAKAVLGARDNDGFTLIQGPPGTGKTKTIVAMVGALLPGMSSAVVPAAKRPAGTPIKKLLVCAPSNAAVDELVLRLKQGVKSLSGNFQKINVIRLGRSEAINSAVRDVTLEELVKRRMEEENIRDNAKADRDKIHSDAAEIKEKVDDLWIKVNMARDKGDRDEMNKFQRELDLWKTRQVQAGAKIDQLKTTGRTVAREVDLKRLQFQREILGSAHVLCATLSGSGHDVFKSLTDVDFETVIIDEAAQCVELSALIPLKYGCVKCILVGDPKQLPPTVLSQSAARYGYDQSLFVRMQQCHPGDVHLLDMQYRMHPLISAFPSKEFYEGRLVDGADMASLRVQPWHSSSLFGPYRFFDVKGSQARGNRGQSLVNVEELNVAMQLYERLRTDYRTCDFKRKIGIITPYKAQLYELRARFESRYGQDIGEVIEFNTTDAFQGRECEIIIFSCVRASPTGGIGFMTDIRRMNVGLTRAKSSLWILGDSTALVQGKFWAKLIDDARDRNLYTNGDVLSLLRRPTEKVAHPQPTSLRQGPNTLPISSPVNNEVEMLDAPRGPASMVSQGPPPPHPSQAAVSHPPSMQRDVNKRIERIDERGQAIPDQQRAVGAPVIHSSAQQNPKKRRPEAASHDGRAAKKGKNTSTGLAANSVRPGGEQRKGFPKVLQGRGPLIGAKRPAQNQPNPRPPPNAPVRPAPPMDPAAMDALGLRPPERAAPSQQGQQGQAAQQGQQGQRAQEPPPGQPRPPGPGGANSQPPRLPNGPARPPGPNLPPMRRRKPNVFMERRR